MNKTIEQNLKTGKNSKSLQIGKITVNNQGISYNDVKEIALDVFRDNFINLSKEASDVANARAEVFTNELVALLEKRLPGAIDEIKNPGFQYSLFEAQKNFAKTGDEDMKGVLIDVLIDRVQQSTRNLKQITLEESISIIPKLLSSQLDILTIVFILTRSVNNNINSIDALKKYLNEYLQPFIENLSKEDSLFAHIEFSGCGSVGIMESSIESIFKNNYRGLFFQGFDEEYFENNIGKVAEYNDFLIKCLNNEDKLQLNAINGDLLEKRFLERNIDSIIAQKLRDLFGQNILSDELVKNKLLELGGESMEKLFDIWNNSSLKHILLTTVGIAIAQANFRRKTGIALDLGIWIK